MATKNCICKCEGCGILFAPKKADRLRFCSRNCAFKNINLIRNNPVIKEKQALNRIAKAKHTKLKSICLLKEVAALIRIKNKNKRQYGTLNKKAYNRCNQCFNLFVFTVEMGRHKSLCSDRCKKQSIKQSKRKARTKLRETGYRNDRTHRSRARHYGVAHELVNVFKVFDRDGWKCHICGTKTPKNKRGTLESNAPELDHIITFAEGGNHTYNNVACCCRKCNNSKGSKSKGQIFLFGKI